MVEKQQNSRKAKFKIKRLVSFSIVCLLCAFILIGLSLNVNRGNGLFLLENEDASYVLVHVSRQEPYPERGEALAAVGDAYVLAAFSKAEDGTYVLNDPTGSQSFAKEGLTGYVDWKSAAAGEVLGFFFRPERRLPVIFGSVFVILAMAVLLVFLPSGSNGRKKKKDIHYVAETGQDHEVQKRKEFMKDVLAQEISPPKEVVSAGNDRQPITDEQLEEFRRKVLEKPDGAGETALRNDK